MNDGDYDTEIFLNKIRGLIGPNEKTRFGLIYPFGSTIPKSLLGDPDVAGFITYPFKTNELSNFLCRASKSCQESVVPNKEKSDPDCGLNILLAEDTKINQMVAISQLESLGHKVLAVENGSLALAALRTGTF